MAVPMWVVGVGMPLMLIATLLSGLPVAFSLSFVGTVTILLIWGPAAMTMLPTASFSSIASFILICVPLFLLIGENLIHSGISDSAYDMMYKWLGRLPGGVAVATIATAAVFGAISGFAPAVCTIMGKMALPEMLKRRYDKGLAAGCILGGAALDLLIPPSILMVVLGFASGESIGKLYFSGLSAGVMIVLMFVVYVVLRAILQPKWCPVQVEAPTWRERAGTLKNGLPLAAVILLILGTVFVGIATPTESAALGFWATLVLVFLYRKFKIRKMTNTLSMTAQFTAMLFMIVIGATLFSRAVAYSGIGEALVSWITSLGWSPWLILIALQVLVLVMGCFMDAASIIFITIPFFMPIVKALGFDTFWFASVMMINLDLGTITPPFGLNLFVLKAVAPPEMSMMDIIKGALPFILIYVLAIVLAMVFPQIVLWLPNLMRTG